MRSVLKIVRANAEICKQGHVQCDEVLQQLSRQELECLAEQLLTRLFDSPVMHDQGTKQQISHLSKSIVADHEANTHDQASGVMITDMASYPATVDVSEQDYEMLLELYNSTCAGVESCKWPYPVPPVCDGYIITCNPTTGAITEMYLCL